MKKCPNCNQKFSDDDFFCPDDGTTLLPVSNAGDDPPVFPAAGDTPTQVITHPVVAASNSTKDPSKWLFLIIGVMAATIVALGITFYFSNGANEKEIANSVKPTEEKSNDTTRIISPSANEDLGPNGKWTGDLSYPRGDAYSAQVDLTDDGNGQINGQIVWTCIANPKRADEIGTRQIEIARGNFDAVTRTLSLESYEKDNPNQLACRFQMTLTEDNGHLNGFVFGKRGTRWNFNLRRF